MAEQIFQPTQLLRVLMDLAKDVREQYKDHLTENDRIASGDLLRSVKSEVEVNGTTYSVVLNLADYWKFVEDDTKPHWPPKDAIDRWIFIKPVIPRPMSVLRTWWTNGRKKGAPKTIYNEKRVQILPTPAQLSYLIRRKIAQDGTKGTHDLQAVKDALLPVYEERILEALERDTIEYIEKIMP